MKSFQSLEYWINDIKINKYNFYKIYLFGNKNDIKNDICIFDNDIEYLINKYNITFFKISVKKNTNIDKMIQFINQDIGEYLVDNTVTLENKKRKNIKFHIEKNNLNESNYDSKCC